MQELNFLIDLSGTTTQKLFLISNEKLEKLNKGCFAITSLTSRDLVDENLNCQNCSSSLNIAIHILQEPGLIHQEETDPAAEIIKEEPLEFGNEDHTTTYPSDYKQEVDTSHGYFDPTSSYVVTEAPAVIGNQSFESTYPQWHPPESTNFPLNTSSYPDPYFGSGHSVFGASHILQPATTFPCQLCVDILPTEAQLRKHMRMKHCIDMYICNECGFKSKTASKLRCHLILRHFRHLAQFKCKQCPVVFVKKFDMNVHHKRNHTDLMKEVCDICNKVIKGGKDGLRWHKRKTHKLAEYGSKVMPTMYSCNKCAKSFRMIHKYEEHVGTCDGVVEPPEPKVRKPRVRKDPVPTGPFECSYCKRILKNRKTLNKHVNNLHADLHAETEVLPTVESGSPTTEADPLKMEIE